MPSNSSALNLAAVPGQFSICRLEPTAGLPSWLNGGEFTSVTWTADELSIVCPTACVPDDVLSDGGWRCMRVVGTIDFSVIGVLNALTAPLAEAGVSVFALSTYDTDYVLVRGSALAAGIAKLREFGHAVNS